MRDFTGEKTVVKHYIAMNGSEGCLPDNCQVFAEGKTEEENKQAAINYLRELFDLSKGQVAVLRADGIIVGGLEGAAYCEVSACDCDNPDIHSDDW